MTTRKQEAARVLCIDSRRRPFLDENGLSLSPGGMLLRRQPELNSSQQRPHMESPFNDGRDLEPNSWWLQILMAWNECSTEHTRRATEQQSSQTGTVHPLCISFNTSCSGKTCSLTLLYSKRFFTYYESLLWQPIHCHFSWKYF